MRTLAAALFFVSASTFACPDLTGNFRSCVSEDGSPFDLAETVVTQSVSNSITTYKFDSLDLHTGERDIATYKADGVMYSIFEVDPHTGMKYDHIKTTTCVGNTLKIDMTTMMEGTEAYYDRLTMSKVNDELIIYIESSDGQPLPVEKITCRK